MEGAVLLVVALMTAPIALAVWLIMRVTEARRRIEELSSDLRRVDRELSLLKEQLRQPESITPAPIEPAGEWANEPTVPPQPLAPETTPPEPIIATPPPLPSMTPVVQQAVPEQALPAPQPEPAPQPTPKLIPAINWEQFMGVKLFAWVGGLALFLGLAFFVKYSFENNLIPPAMRVTIGFIAGVGLIVGGLVMSRKQYAVLSQTLCATGVVVLYSVAFACHSIYHFAFFGAIPTFVLMALITATAFFIAVRLNALVVAILGMLGGFLTPILLSTGVDNPLGLFGYIAILDVGLIVVALNRRWMFLTALAALGTVLIQIGWVGEFFESQRYFAGNKILVPFAVLLGFTALYLIATGLGRRHNVTGMAWLSGAGAGLVAMSIAFSGWFLTFPSLSQRPWLMFGFVFAINLIAIALTLLDSRLAPLQPLAGMATFGLLAMWTTRSLTAELLTPALAFYFVFAVMHAMVPLVQQRRGKQTGTMWASQLFPWVSLALVLIPILKLSGLSFLVWPFVLLVDVLAIVVAILTASLIPVIGVLLLTLAAMLGLIFKIPSDLTGVPLPFYLIGAFAIFFVTAGIWLSRKLKFQGTGEVPSALASELPVLGSILPFLLLIMATLRLPLPNPSPLFGLALLLVVLALVVTRLYSITLLPAVALGCVAALECAWHFHRFNPSNVAPTLVWYVLFYAVFTLYPFFFRHRFQDKTAPWAASALAGPLQFFLIHRLIIVAYPNDHMGLLPAAFAIAPLISLAILLKKTPETPTRMTQLAWFGGIALFFITLIVPIQFTRQWITIGWALEGVALLWLFHRVPHPGLRATGVGLLITAFIRLALNFAVLHYKLRGDVPILNWYLYAYGLVTVCLFAGARLVAPPRQKVLGNNACAILNSLGTVLAFILVNIEIADFFSAPGSRLTFEFSGNFGRDMTYSIAWALFALVLLVVGIAKRLRAARYAALALFTVTLLKLFFHDLARLGALYRIGALIGVAIIAMLASFAYQRFYATNAPSEER